MTEIHATAEDVLERVDDAFFALDTEWRFTYLNEQAETVLDVDRDRIIGNVVWEEFEPAAGTKFQSAYERAMETQEPVSFEGFYPPLETWFEVNAYPSETGLSVYFDDVTDRKERERELERYERIVESAQDGIYVVDDGRFEMVNQALTEQLGYEREELVGEPLTKVLDEEAVDELATIEDELVSGERSSASKEVMVERANGSTFEAEATFSMLPDETRVGVVRDISDRKEREQQLELYEEVVGTIEDGIYAVNDDSRFIMVNDAFCEMTGYSRSELLGERVTMVKDERVTARAERLSREFANDGRGGETIEFDLETRDGEKIPVEDRIDHLSFEDDFGRCGVARDLTERKKRERELERLRDLLARAERLANVGGWEVDPETEEVFWSGNLFELLGLEPDEEPSLEGALDVYVDEDRPMVEQAIEVGIARQEPFDIEARFERTDGEIRWLDIQGVPITEDGEVVVLRGAVQDITDRKKFERQLVGLHSVSRDLLRAESTEEIASAAIDAIHDILDAPSAFYYQFDPDEGVLEPIEYLDDNNLIAADPEPVETDEENLLSVVFDSDETRHLEDVTASPHFRDPEGKIDIRSALIAPVGNDGVLAAGASERGAFDENTRQLVDIVATTTSTAFNRVERERLLRRQHDQLLALSDIDSLVHGLAESMFGLSAREEIERLVCDRLAESNSYAFAWVGTEQDGEVTVSTEAGVSGYLDDTHISLEESPTKSGPTSQAHLTSEMQVVQDIHTDPDYEPWRDRASEYGYCASAAIPLAKGDEIHGTLNVYTSRSDAFDEAERDALRRLGSIIAYAFSSVERDRKLQQERNRLEFMNRLLRHNLLNSLNVVEARLELLDGRVDYEVSDHLRTATDRTSDMIQFVQTIREVTKIIGHTSEHERKPKAIGDVLSDRVDAAQQSYPYAEFTLGSVPAVDVLADDLLGEVLDNILINAVQHNTSDPPKIWVDTTVDDETVTVTVADNGPGIPDEEKEAVFDRESRDFQDPDSGFGLYLVKEIVDSYGGSITVEDNDPTGAVFRIVFQRA